MGWIVCVKRKVDTETLNQNEENKAKYCMDARTPAAGSTVEIQTTSQTYYDRNSDESIFVVVDLLLILWRN